MERIAKLKQDRDRTDEILFEDGLFTINRTEQVKPSQLLVWEQEGRIEWEQKGIKEWVVSYIADTPLSRKKSFLRTSKIRNIIIASIMLLVGVVGASFMIGQLALKQDRDIREMRLNNAILDVELAERMVTMFNQEVANLTEESPQDNWDDNSENGPIIGPKEGTFSQYAIIKTWYSTGGFSSETAWVHFKAVDEQGTTVMEVLGSDEVNMRKEQSSLNETQKRRELVQQLRKDMASAGWTEVGVANGGEWYQYIFGR